MKLPEMNKVRSWVQTGYDPRSSFAPTYSQLQELEHRGLIKMDDLSISGAQNKLYISLTGLGEYEALRTEVVARNGKG